MILFFDLIIDLLKLHTKEKFLASTKLVFLVFLRNNLNQ